MPEIRCKKCNKLLGYIQGDYEIKCPRCKPEHKEKGNTNKEKESVGMVISKKELLGAIAYCGMRQCPHNIPRKFNEVIDKVSQIVDKEFDSMGSFKSKAFENGKEFYNWLKTTLTSIQEFNEWNLSENEYRKGISVDDESRPKYLCVDRYSNVPEDNDFIDLDACIRNIYGLMLNEN
jgi:phage FluMu protein Com